MYLKCVFNVHTDTSLLILVLENPDEKHIAFSHGKVGVVLAVEQINK